MKALDGKGVITSMNSIDNQCVHDVRRRFPVVALARLLGRFAHGRGTVVNG
jgi:hypothetical protein